MWKLYLIKVKFQSGVFLIEQFYFFDTPGFIVIKNLYIIALNKIKDHFIAIVPNRSYKCSLKVDPLQLLS